MLITPRWVVASASDTGNGGTAMRHKELDPVDLGDGVRGVILMAFTGRGHDPAYLVEVFLLPGSVGDAILDFSDGPDGTLVPVDPVEYARVRGQEPSEP